MRPIPLLAAVFLSACTQMQWEKAGVAPAQLSSDQSECQREAKVQASLRAGPNSAHEPYFSRGGMVYPSGASVDPQARQMLVETRLAQDCMEARGYKLGPKP
jgi:hypothetical protein